MSDSGAKSTGSRKRVSFLMPYIDFCFMLIIIFVGMLSIAYFEPLGIIDMQTKYEDTINQREGINEVKPRGIQEKNFGPGEQQADAGVVPLSDSSAGGSAANINQRDLDALRRQLERYRREIESLRGNGAAGADVAELERLKKLEQDLAAKIKEIESLKAIQAELLARIAELEKLKTAKTGQDSVRQGSQGSGVDEKGNHIYIDLRKGGGS